MKKNPTLNFQIPTPSPQILSTIICSFHRHWTLTSFSIPLPTLTRQVCHRSTLMPSGCLRPIHINSKTMQLPLSMAMFTCFKGCVSGVAQARARVARKIQLNKLRPNQSKAKPLGEKQRTHERQLRQWAPRWGQRARIIRAIFPRIYARKLHCMPRRERLSHRRTGPIAATRRLSGFSCCNMDVFDIVGRGRWLSDSDEKIIYSVKD